MTGRRRPAPPREREIEARLVERLVDEIAEELQPEVSNRAIADALGSATR